MIFEADEQMEKHRISNQEDLKEDVLYLPVKNVSYTCTSMQGCKDAYIRTFVITLFVNVEHRISLTLAD